MLILWGKIHLIPIVHDGLSHKTRTMVSPILAVTDPRRRKPVVSLAGVGGPRTSMSFSLVEYWEMVLVMEVASVGLMWKRSGKGEWPEVEVRMRVFIGLTKHPSGAQWWQIGRRQVVSPRVGCRQRRHLHS